MDGTNLNTIKTEKFKLYSCSFETLRFVGKIYVKKWLKNLATTTFAGSSVLVLPVLSSIDPSQPPVSANPNQRPSKLSLKAGASWDLL